MKREKNIRAEEGVVLITTLLLILLLMVVGVSGLGLSRSDLLVSRNLLTGVQALWTARAGIEDGKNWLEANLSGSALPVTLGPTMLENGAYTVSIVTLGNGAYGLTSVGTGPGESRRVVEEIIRLPDFTPLGVITSDGDGLHPDFDDGGGGLGRRIPDFNVDGRNYALDGSLSPLCPSLSPFAASQVTAQNDLDSAVNTLKRELATRANGFCHADGSNAAGTCTPGLSWVRGAGVLPRFQTGSCILTDPTCFLNLDLGNAALRALAIPPESHLPPAPDNRGPFTPGPGGLPFVRLLSSAERSRLQTALDDMSLRFTELPEEKVSHISSSLHGGHYAYGSLAEPAIVRVAEGVGTLDLDGGAVMDGTGILLIPRVVRLGDATFNWKGIVVIVGAGDLRIEDASACGQVLGAVVVRDDATLDRKLDLDLVQGGGGCPPFAINYSCEAVTRALTTLMRTVSWIEKYGA
ncbi:MAG: hypothetical protein AB7P69_03220 [Candidatus Binatia bacterium]